MTREPARFADLSDPALRRKAFWNMVWGDHAFLRIGFQNAHWIDDKLVRTNQPWPFQVRRWAAQGVKTIINLRGGWDTGMIALEREACADAGLAFVTFAVEGRAITSRAIPDAGQILAAKALFEGVQYPALIHCKSGADRAGMMAALYCHFQLGQPIAEARKQLSWRYLHARAGKTGVLDFFLDHYVDVIEPTGVSFLDWVQSDAFDPDALKAQFHSTWWGRMLTEGVLRRE
jgi:protein tyrosine/serine phosphatase